MGLLDNILGSGGKPAVPGGDFAKPLLLALLALFASGAMSGGRKQEPASPAPSPSPDPSGAAAPDPSPDSVVDGLGGLLAKLRQKGLGDQADSWVKSGPNKDVSPNQIDTALGRDVLDELSSRTGLSRDQILDQLARILPAAVDRMTPEGRLPTGREMARLTG
jgi:uncharacterized protein YidB (DUF937 family)